jgi:transcription antitermination factor NusG
MKKNWYAVFTKLNCEKKVVASLSKKKIEHFCPQNRIVTYHGNKKRTTSEPLINAFVFVYADENEMKLLAKIPFVVNFVYWLGKPVIIKHSEIENIKDFVNQHVNIKLEKVNVNMNGIVRMISEPHVDLNNSLLSVRNSNFKILLPSLGYILMAEVEKQAVDIFNRDFETKQIAL